MTEFDRFRPHPWHGLSPGPNPPHVVDAYIEITPFDAVKYEILRVDRPQGSSALPPTLYGFIPQTFCGTRVAELTPLTAAGDEDPLDICVLSQQRIDRAEVVIPARVVGGLQLLDGGEADDKIIAVLASDSVLEYALELRHLPEPVVNRIVHYFATYKMQMTGDKENAIEVIGTYEADHARAVISAALEDYRESFLEG